MSLSESVAGDGVMRYRAQAARFLELAEVAPMGRARSQLLYLASRSELLASSLKAETDARSALLLWSSRADAHTGGRGSGRRCRAAEGEPPARS